MGYILLINLSIHSNWTYTERKRSSPTSSTFIVGAPSAEDQNQSSVRGVPVIPRTPTDQSPDFYGDPVGGNVANTMGIRRRGDLYHIPHRAPWTRMGDGPSSWGATDESAFGCI